MSDDLPRLVVVFDPTVPTLHMVQESAGIWQSVWLIDRNEPGVEDWVRQLRRLGETIDSTDLSADEVADAVSAHNPSGIIAFTDPGVAVASAIGTRLDLPGYSALGAERLSSKLAQRDALRDAGVAVPEYNALPAGTTSAQLASLAQRLRYPVIVKPQSGTGSRDTYLAKNSDELLAVFDGRLRHDSDLIIEEQLADGWPRAERPDADFVSVESLVARGRLSHLAITGRTALAEPFRETGSFIPSNLPQDAVTAVLDAAGAAVMAMDTDTGVFHTEIKLSPDGPRVIEVNGRVGGYVAQLLQSASGESILTIAGRVALGQEVAYDELLPCTRVGYSILIVPALDATRLTRLDGLAEVNQIPGIYNISLDRRVGDPLDWREGSASRIATIYGETEDLASMWVARQLVLDTIQLDYERA
jgi:biotin carboxylase